MDEETLDTALGELLGRGLIEEIICESGEKAYRITSLGLQTFLLEQKNLGIDDDE